MTEEMTPMGKHKFTSLLGEPFWLKTPMTFRRESFYIVSPPKAGSVLINNLVKSLCEKVSLPYFDFEPQLFQSGVSPNDCPLDAYKLLDRRGYVFLGFRTPYMLRYSMQYRKSPKLILVRDPRDMLVSYYFSIAKSHAVPGGSIESKTFSGLRNEAATIDINEYISRGSADHIVLAMRAIKSHLQDFQACHLYRYEDIIFEKKAWIRSMASVLGVEVSDDLMAELLAQYDVLPDSERPNQHVRQVSPGNYKKHLTKTTIAIVEEKFADVMEHFDYSPDSKG